MNNKALDAIRAYEKAGEELANVLAVAALDNKLSLSIEEGRELMDRILQAELNGGRAERTVLEVVALKTAMEVMKRKVSEQMK